MEYDEVGDGVAGMHLSAPSLCCGHVGKEIRRIDQGSNLLCSRSPDTSASARTIAALSLATARALIV